MALAVGLALTSGASFTHFVWDADQITTANADRDLARNCRTDGSTAPKCPVVHDGPTKIIYVKAMPQTPISSADDATKWQIWNRLHDGPKIDPSTKEVCVVSVTMVDAKSKSFWESLYPLVLEAGWNVYGGIQPSRWPEGIDISTNKNSGSIIRCGNQLVSVFHLLKVDHVRFLTNQMSPTLTQCSNDCLEVTIGHAAFKNL